MKGSIFIGRVPVHIVTLLLLVILVERCGIRLLLLQRGSLSLDWVLRMLSLLFGIFGS